MKVNPTPPSGFRDFLPGEATARQKLISLISDTYQSYGFQPIGMSFLENLSTLQGKGGGTDNEKLIFKVMKRGEDLERSLAAKNDLADLGLRFDLTLPLARYYSRFREQLPKPFKVFQIGPVWRADRPQKGRYREFYQCDVDIIDAKEIGAEAECLSAILTVMKKLGLADVEVHLNDRRLLSALRGSVPEDKWALALVALDKLDKIGPDGVKKELAEKLGSVPDGIAKVLEESAINAFESVNAESTTSLKELIALLTKLHSKVVFNPSLVRGQDYYTGTIFELRYPGLSGSLGGGGRYNRLLEIFGGPSTPAFGGSIGFERLALILEERGGFAEDSGVPQVFFPLFESSLRGNVLELAEQLRSRGVRVDISPDAAKLKNQFKYADDRKIPFVATLGGDELAKHCIKVKRMATREENTFSLDEFADKMEQLCKQNTV